MVSPALSAEDDSGKEIYRYIHEDGSIVFTDDPLNIPEKYRKDAVPVALSPLMTIPVQKATPQPKGPSGLTRLKSWFGNLSPWTRIAVGGALPMIGLSLWALYFLGRRTSNPSAKFLLKFMIGLIVAASAYLFYFSLMKSQTERMTRGLPIQIDTSAPLSEMLAPIQQEEENRLRRIEEIADSP